MSNKGVLLESLSEQEIADLIKSGDISLEDGFSILAPKLSKILWRYLQKRYSLVDDDVADLVASTLMDLWTQFNDFDPDKGHLVSYAIGIALNKVRMFLRETYREVSVPDEDLESIMAVAEESTVTKSADFHLFQERTQEALSYLSDTDREILLLKVSFDLTYEEMADLLAETYGENSRFTPQALSQRYYRSKKRLQSLLEE